jgi:uncharacterized lipoprotein
MTLMSWFAAVTSVAITAACGYSTPKEPEAGGTSVEAPPPPKDESTSEATTPPDDAPPAPPTGACDDRACSVDQDCCTGYGCALDPERSRVQRYCLAQ